MEPDDAVNKALDACHKAGIGLVAMKTMRALRNVPQRLPEFDSLGLTTHQALLQAVWSDERIASICSQMTNTDQMTQNTESARKYKEPLKKAQIDTLREAVLAANPTFCPGCEGCRAYAARSGVDLQDLTRYVSYYETDGDVHAQEMFRSHGFDLGALRRSDLAAASAACYYHVDYEAVVRRAERYFATA
jgi:hypothetical protein